VAEISGSCTPLWKAVCKLWKTVCKLWKAVCKLRKAVCKLWKAVCKLRSNRLLVSFWPVKNLAELADGPNL
jgi:hypothetical protein